MDYLEEIEGLGQVQAGADIDLDLRGGQEDEGECQSSGTFPNLHIAEAGAQTSIPVWHFYFAASLETFFFFF